MTPTASARIRPLDAKFAKVVALMRSTQHEGEKANAYATAARLAADAGMTLDEALAASEPAPSIVDIFAGFDDHLERQQPGFKARRQTKRSERERARLERRAKIIARYGSEEATLAPCERERLLQKALAPWITWCKPPHQRWTYSIDGYGGFFHGMPPYIRDAVANAYPLPATFAEACAEADYWRDRNQEMEDVLGERGDYGLDRPAYMRMLMVEGLADHELLVTTIADLHKRFARYRAREINDEEVEEALFRDLTALNENPRYAGTVGESDSETPASVQPNGQIDGLLREHPDWSDRRIARAAGCSPTTVGKVRRTIGATCATRSVHRNGQTYEIHISPRDIGTRSVDHG